MIEDVFNLIWVVKNFANQMPQGTENARRAIESIGVALNHTENFLAGQNEFVTNFQLANLWLRAADDASLVNEQLGQLLRLKSQFWSNPAWFAEAGREDDVATLAEVRREIQGLQGQFPVNH